jgi:hypothetical protein
MESLRGSHRDVLVWRHRSYRVNVDHGVGIPNRSRHSMASAGINRKDALFLASVACHGTYAIAYPSPTVPQVVCHLTGTPQD